MKRFVAITLTAVALIAAATSGELATAPQARAAQQPITFSGSCAFAGQVRFQPPLTNTPQTARDLASAHGTCSGTLTDQRGRTRKLQAAPVRYFASDQGSDVSCALSPHATGSGTLMFPSGNLAFTLAETRAGGTAELSLTGIHGGSATGVANISPSANPAHIAAQCAGSGLSEAPVDINIQTTPAITG